VASALLVLGLVVAMVHLHAGEPRLAAVDDPEGALALIVSRTMDLRAALAGAPAWEQRLYGLVLPDAASDVGQAIAWYEELAAHTLAPAVDLRLAVLLGEAGRRQALEETLEQWPARGDPLASWTEVVARAYLGAGDAGPEAETVHEMLLALGPGWFADALALRLSTRLGDAALGQRADDALARRAAALLWRARALGILDVLVLAVGGLAVPGLWRRLRAGRGAVAEALLPPPWSMAAGLAALVRGAALSALLLLVAVLGGGWLAGQPLLTGALDQPLTFVPVLLVVWRMLLAPAGLGFVTAFGLRPRPGGGRPLVHAVLVLFAAGTALDLGLGVLSDRLELGPHWTEWFDADLASGEPARVAVTVLGAVLFAPLFEELVFRGVLYGSLRARLGWPAAAVASALVFGLAHGYGVAGLLSVFVSGVLWAWFYERTGSLLPGIAAHVANNAVVAVTLLALLR
jgi:membrane protease YdiL (CAAX protease family)